MFQEKAIQSNTVRIDWSEVWNRQVLRRREFGKVANSTGQWDSRESAFRYWETTLKTQYDRIKDTINEIEISARSRVLDIGSGPGVMALPLANRVAHITAIEPLKGMVEVMREKIVKRKIQNISWIQKYWEEINVNLDLKPLYDVVIASLSLNMIGIRDAIKMKGDGA
jgi:2-polyprenyl-3-methyl-5-hydroxy-6-metoxy-1,4-benzoquinol methylase